MNMKSASTLVAFLGIAFAAPLDNAHPALAGRQNDPGVPFQPFVPIETATTTTPCHEGSEITPTPTTSLSDDSPLGPFDEAAGLQERQFAAGDSFGAFLDDLGVIIDQAMAEASTAEVVYTETTPIIDATTSTIAFYTPTSIVDDTLDPLGPIDGSKEKRQAELLQPLTGLLGGVKEKRQSDLIQPVTGILLSGLKEKRQLDVLTGLLGGLLGGVGGGGAAPPQVPDVPVTSEATTISDATLTTTSIITTATSSVEDLSDFDFNQKRDHVPGQSGKAADKLRDVTSKLSKASQDLTPDEKTQLGAKAIQAYCARYDPQCCWLNDEDSDNCTWDF